MKTILIGKITEVSPVETKPTYSSQNFKLTVQDYDTATGEPKDPQVFPITVFNKKIAELQLETKLNTRQRVTCWLRSLKKEQDNKTFYNIALNAASIQEG